MKTMGHDFSKTQRQFIRIADAIVMNNELQFKLTFSDGMKRYFRENTLRITYDQSIERVDKSILSIPALAAVITVAWGAGADVYLDTVDSRFLESLERVKQVFKKWFPKFSFSTQIHVSKSVTPSAPAGKHHALLFSGGLDALASYIKHKDEKPTLITVRWNIPIREQQYWSIFKEKIQAFANQENATVRFIETNELELINNDMAARDFLAKPAGSSWYGDVTHGLLITTVVAPLLEDYETLWLASSDFIGVKNPEKLGTQGSLVFHEVDMLLGSAKVVYDIPELTRIGKIKKYIVPSPKYASSLVVCNSEDRFFKPSAEFLNCCFCEKCLRTILELVSENINPTACNFPLRRTKDTLKLIKDQLQLGVLASDWTIRMEWRGTQLNLQQKLKSGEANNIPGAVEFFRWFLAYDLNSVNMTPISVLEKRMPLSPILYCYSVLLTRHRDLKYVASYLRFKLNQKFAK